MKAFGLNQWMLLVLVIASITGVLCPMVSNGDSLSPNAGSKGVILPSQASESAKAAILSSPWIRNLLSTVERNRLSTGDPLLVRRIDRTSAYYYLVPFNSDDFTAMVVIIDAKNGRFKECSRMAKPEVYPKVNAKQAIQILSAHLNMIAHDCSLTNAKLRLVWRPCEQTQSPYEPLWRIQIHSNQWFIDQKGILHNEIHDIRIKGGGPD
jgi:hypothetical protein